MAKRFGGFSFSVSLLLIALAGLASSADPPASSPPSPAPRLGPASPASAPSPPPSSIRDAPNSSPPSPPPESESPPHQAPASTPTPGSTPPVESPPTPTPAPNPSDVSDVSHSDMNGDADDEASSPGGMSGAKKAGIAVGVIAAVCLVGIGGLVYKKRQDNIRRSQYGYAARRELL